MEYKNVGQVMNVDIGKKFECHTFIEDYNV